MKDEDKTKEQLLQELKTLRGYVPRLERVKTKVGLVRHLLRKNIEQFKSIYQAIACGVIVRNAKGNVVYANEAACKLMGLTLHQLRGRAPIDPAWRAIYQDGSPFLFETCPSMLTLRTGKSISNVVIGIFPAGQEGSISSRESGSARKPRWILMNSQPILDPQTLALKGAVDTFIDITEFKRHEETILRMAYYDTLTDLPNRILFSDRLTMELAHTRREQKKLAVLLLNLDRFRVINDSLGHTFGDRLLQSVAFRLRNCVREGDTVARLGGDEFLLLITGIMQPEDAAKVVQKIFEALKPPFHFEGHELHITASVGVALYPDDGEDAQTLLKSANTALHRAKEQGRDTYQLHTATMNAKAFDRLMLEHGLRRALERDELVVYYQPQVNLHTKQIVGMEALVRWQHPDQGIILPARFIPLAEETGLIIPIGERVLQAACAQNKAWQDAGFPPIRVSVNLSARHFKQKNLVEIIARTLKETGLDPKYLDLELTEGTIMENAEETIKTLRALKDMGVHLSIDDFGTGYSSLNYLRRFPIDTLKIDQSFVQDIPTNPDDAAITAAIIAMTHSLKLKVMAEGVETEEQLPFLYSQHCDEVQGYYFSKPLPPEAFTQLLKEGARLKP
jgi:diguanylate cyclase (GGDEF)-like protein